MPCGGGTPVLAFGSGASPDTVAATARNDASERTEAAPAIKAAHRSIQLAHHVVASPPHAMYPAKLSLAAKSVDGVVSAPEDPVRLGSLAVGIENSSDPLRQAASSSSRQPIRGELI